MFFSNVVESTFDVPLKMETTSVQISRREAIKLTLAGTALFTPESSLAEDPVNTLDLVFEGGGIKGAAFCGALEVLESHGYSYRHIIGTSAGAITAALLAAGYSSKAMQGILTKPDIHGNNAFNSFLLPPTLEASETTPSTNDGKFSESLKNNTDEKLKSKIVRLFGSAKSVTDAISENALRATGESKRQWDRMRAFIATGAFASDAAFLAWLSAQLKVSPLLKQIDKDIKEVRSITLKEFHNLTQVKGVQLSVVAADVTGMRVLVLNQHTAPQLPLVDAVRMSMGIPMVWPEVEWKEDWGKYRGKIEMWNCVNGGNRIVDGGVLSNFPLRYLIDPRHVKETGVLGGFSQNVTTRLLGFLLDESLSIPGVDQDEEKKNLATRQPAYQSLSRVINAMNGAGDQESIEDAQSDEIKKRGLCKSGPLCRIPVKGYQALDFNMDGSKMGKLIESGSKAMKDYFATGIA